MHICDYELATKFVAVVEDYTEYNFVCNICLQISIYSSYKGNIKGTEIKAGPSQYFFDSLSEGYIKIVYA